MIKYNLGRTILSGAMAVAASFALSACGGGGGTSSEGGGDSCCGGGDNRSHYAGRSCIDGNCHGTSAESDKRWSYAGTVYTDATGATAAAGTSVVITQLDGTTISLTTDSLGNFWTRTGSASGGYTASVNGGTSMATVATNGSCSMTGCHGSGTLKIYKN